MISHQSSRSRAVLIRPGILSFAFILTFATGCRREIVPEPYRPTSDHDAYRHSLVEMGLDNSALGRDWIMAAKRSLDESVFVTTPIREARYVDHGEAFAIAYGFDVPRGRQLEIAVTFESVEPSRVFVDLFRVSGETSPERVHVASADRDDLRLKFEPRWDGRYVLRVQPELLREGRCEIVIRQDAALAFPVQGKNQSAIGSRFGDPRDGGRRIHRGVDIFAPRHTPVLAPADAFVHHVGENRLGGRCIWLRDREHSRYYYLAHLESWIATENTWVKQGDPVGTVGNSGNARTTPPHLHFAVSANRSFIDPYPFLRRGEPEATPISGNLELLGRWARSRADLSSATPAEMSIPRYTPMRIIGAAANRFQVRLPGGQVDWLPARHIESAVASLSEHSLGN
ncbi:MAG: M23 family metallopeptidase, partial [bacterium]|nr:M23 family metallopeptidase [bacterium]